MQIIHLSHKEQVAYSQLCSLAWQSLVDEKELARIATLPDPDPRRWGALSEDGTLAAGLTCHDFRAFVQGEAVSNGGIGGVVGAALIGVLYALAINHWGSAGADLVQYAVIGAAGGAISQIGDLAASAIKRYHNIKDYGKLIPGHGGILDRFDSVIFTAPIIYYLAVLL